MLHLIPAPLHRVALRHAYRVRRLWWRVRRPVLSGVAVIAQDGRGRVLLVRLSYGPAVWSLPAGGIAAGEDPETALHREFAEELRCPLADIRLLSVHEDDLHGATDRLHLFAARLAGEPRPDRREVIDARLFDPLDLPENVDRRVPERLALRFARQGRE